VCDYYRNWPNLVGMMVFVVPWGCAKHIGKNSNEIDIYRISQYITATTKTEMWYHQSPSFPRIDVIATF